VCGEQTGDTSQQRLTWLSGFVARSTPTISKRGRPRPVSDAGMSTAEYAVGTVAAVAFAAVLFKVVRSPAVQAALSDIVTSALHVSL
jgi:hypothetical protein